MANVLTGLIPQIMLALDTVSREMVGMIPAVSRNSSAERAALNQVVRVPVTGAETAADNTPNVTPPDTGDKTTGYVDMAITKSRHVPIRFNGEETKGLQNAGVYSTIVQDRFSQAFRTLANEIEADLASSYTSSSRAFGTAGTAPFGTAGDLSDIAGVWQILADNGMPDSDKRLVLSSAAIANIMGKQTVLFKVNEAGNDDLLRRGIVGDLEGFRVHKSAQMKAHTKGSGASYLVNNADLAAGATAVAVDTGSGTILAGDVVTLATDDTSSKYIVGAALGGGSFSVNAPGLRDAIADDAAVTVGNSYRANLAFHRSAIQLATRLPAMPEGGDSADDRMTLTDPVSGLIFEIAVYRQYLQVSYHVRLAWGWTPVKPEYIATLLG